MGPDTPDRAALESMLLEYSTKQLVEEVLVAWDELTKKNEDFSDLKQKIRILELDLAERQDGIAPEIERLGLVENELIKIEKPVLLKKITDLEQKLTKILIAKGADLNVKLKSDSMIDDNEPHRSKSGDTVLHEVARSYSENHASEVCELLIKNGAQVNETNIRKKRL